MTSETLAELTAKAKKYARIDYTDDDDLVEIMVEAAVESLADVIPSFDADKMTGAAEDHPVRHRQRPVRQPGEVRQGEAAAEDRRRIHAAVRNLRTEGGAGQ